MGLSSLPGSTAPCVFSFTATRVLLESNSHRRARRKRTQARTALRGFVSGHVPLPLARVQQAISELDGHHSRSHLPRQARQKLRSLAGTSTTMSASTQSSWWCYRCKQWDKASAEYCPGCGKHWTLANKEGSSYTAQPAQDGQERKDRRPSRGRDRRRSPRGGATAQSVRQLPLPPPPPAPGGKGRKGNGKDKGKHGGKGAPEVPTAPVLQAPVPAPSSSSQQDPKMMEMLQALAAHRDSLPASVKALLTEQEEAQTASKAKELHKHVNMQHSKSRRLASLRSQREQYLSQWHKYVETLATSLQKQIEEKDAALHNFAASESALVEEIDGARAMVLQLAAGDRLSSEDLEKMDEEPELWAVETPEQLQREAQLLSLLQQTSQAAAIAAAAPPRDGSRTPRRGAKDREAAFEICDEEAVAAQAKGGHTKAPLPSDMAVATPPAAKAAKTDPGHNQGFH